MIKYFSTVKKLYCVEVICPGPIYFIFIVYHLVNVFKYYFTVLFLTLHNVVIISDLINFNHLKWFFKVCIIIIFYLWVVSWRQKLLYLIKNQKFFVGQHYIAGISISSSNKKCFCSCRGRSCSHAAAASLSLRFRYFNNGYGGYDRLKEVKIMFFFSFYSPGRVNRPC